MRHVGSFVLALGALGAAPCVAQQPAADTLRVRHGQEWTYRARALDSGSTLVVLKVDRGTGLQPVHVCLRGVRVPRAGGGDTAVVHLAIAPGRLREELGALVRAAGVRPEPDCEAGRRRWERQKPYPGVWIGSVRSFVGTVARTLVPLRPARDPRQCELAGGEADTAVARRCAEAFVRRNGYTDAAGPLDTALVVSESLEWLPLEDALEFRRGSLRASAEAAQCGADECTVWVAYAPPGDPRCTFRGVTMTRTYGGMRVEHQDMYPPPGSERARACAAGGVR